MRLNIERFNVDNAFHFIRSCSFIVWAFFSLPLSLFAQNDIPASLEWSEEFNVPSNTALHSILGSDKEHIYILRSSYSMSKQLKSITVEKYETENLQLIKATAIDLKYQKRLRTFHDILKVKDQFFLITSYHNLSKKKNYLFAQRLNHNFEPQELIKIGEIDARNEVHAGFFGFDISRDSSKILVYHKVPTKRSESEESIVHVYNQDFELMWKKRISMPYENKLFELKKYYIDNKGNAYILGKHYFEKIRDERKNKPNYEYVLEAYSKNGAHKSKYILNDKERFISDLTFEVNSKEEIICTGFFTDNVDKGLRADPIQGTFYFKVNNITNVVGEKTFSKFDLDFIALNESNYVKRRMERKSMDDNEDNDPALYNYDFRDLILRSDGGVVLIAEQFYVVTRDYNNFNSTGISRQYNTYHFNDIIVVNIRPDGSIQWCNSIPKTQYTTDARSINYLSFSNAVVKDKIYFVYNESRRAFEEKSSSFGYNLRNSVIALAEFNKKGELSIYPLTRSMDTNIITMPVKAEQISKKEMLIYGESGNYFKIAKINLK